MDTNIKEFRINGTSPFHSHGDAVHERLSEASALICLVAQAHRVCKAEVEARIARAHALTH